MIFPFDEHYHHPDGNSPLPALVLLPFIRVEEVRRLLPELSRRPSRYLLATGIVPATGPSERLTWREVSRGSRTALHRYFNCATA